MKNNKKVKFIPVNERGVLNLFHFKKDEGKVESNNDFWKTKLPAKNSNPEDQPGTSKSFNTPVSPCKENETDKKIRHRKNKNKKRDNDASQSSNSSIDSKCDDEAKDPAGKVCRKQLKIERESKWKARKLQQLESTSSSDITMPKRETQEEFGAVVCSSSLINVETSNDGEMFNFGSGTCTETGFQKDDDRNTRTSFNDMGCGTDEHNIDTETQTDHKITRHDVECGTDELAVNVSTQTDDSDSDMDHRDVSCGTDELNLSVETQTYDLDRSNDVIIDIPEEMVPIRSSRPTKNFSPLTELKVVKFGTDWKFNFIGAFLDFDSLDKKEIMKVQKMLMDTSYEVCERARCVKKLKALKDGLTA